RDQACARDGAASLRRRSAGATFGCSSAQPRPRQVRAAAGHGADPLAPKPLLRGVFHEWCFYVAVPLGMVFGLAAETTRGRIAAAVFAATVVGMFGSSALYHRI